MLHKDLHGNIHDDDDGRAIHLLPQGSVEITDEEAEQIRLASIPQPTLADLTENVREALQNAIDDKAREFEFTDGNSLMLYASAPNDFQELALKFLAWEASVWSQASAYKAQVIAGKKPMLTGAEAVAMMPTYPA